MLNRPRDEGRSRMLGIKAYYAEDKYYFQHNQSVIEKQNRRMLWDSCILYGVVLAIYTAYSVSLEAHAIMRGMYFVFDGIHLALWAVTLVREAKHMHSFRWTQALCVAFEASILSFFALEGALMSPDQHSLYVPIAIMLVQIVFIHPIGYSMLIIALYTASFALLSCCYKTPEAYRNDVLIAMATFLSANIGCILIAKLRRSERHSLMEYERLSMTDVLTGLYNKGAMETLSQPAIADAAQRCTLLILDLDDFKQINDRYGHIVGDEALQKVGTLINSVFRAEDIKARFGGDEFIVLMNRWDDGEAVKQRLSVLRRKMGELSLSVPDLRVHYCAGVTCKREGDTFRTMLERADQALYAAKSRGKDRVEVL